MSTTEFTPEDQLVTDLVTYWTANLPTGVTAGTPVVHFRREATLAIPSIIIGHDGAQRETAKGMTGTARVALRVALRTDIDLMTSANHRAMAAALDRAIQGMATQPGPLAYTYIHAMLREGSTTVITDRREITGLSYLAIVTRCN